MPRRVYIETTIPSYLTARPSRDIVQAARQQLTREWWDVERRNYDLCISQIVLDEAAAGDAEAAQRRMAVIDTLPLLDLTFEVDGLAGTIMQSGLLPASASRDAVHIAVTAVHQVHFLLTWNCRHIANATIFRDLQIIIMSAGYDMPVICTPEELLGN
jgi:predicted nucleic acid-binding protein